MDAVVKTRYGDVRGSVADGVNTFKGIPYAAPPFGANRLRPPQPVEPWSGVRDATTFGSCTPQVPQPPGGDSRFDMLIPEELSTLGEDCLNLNIWTPELGSAGLPVMVWIYGGMLELGSNTQYDGSRFARDGIVCVAINYRVGFDGFLCLGDGNANLGLLDQVAALEWVRENIAAFGGDPGNVTIFGQSAGGISVGTLLSMPRAEGLFHRAIAQSGEFQAVMSTTTAQRVGQQFAKKLDVEATREAIAAVPLERMIAAQGELKADLLAYFTAMQAGIERPDPDRWGLEVLNTTMLWQPVIDGDVIPGHPIDRIAAGAGASVDVMVGTNIDDWRLFLVASGAIDQVADEALIGMVAAYGLPVDVALAAYHAAYPGASPGDLLAAIQTDWWVRIPAIRLADAHAKSTSATYMYEFAWRSPEFNGVFGACHALEIPFVFDTLDKGSDQMLGALLGANPPQQLADTMHAAWIAFATSGGSGWPKYDLSRRATMHFDMASEVVDDPRSAERALWEGVR